MYAKINFRFRDNFLTRMDDGWNSGNFRESLRENAKSINFTTYFTFLITFCVKMPNLENFIQSFGPFKQVAYIINDSTLIFAKKFIVSWKCLHFCKIFAKILKKNFNFNSISNWILTLLTISFLFSQNIMLFFLKWHLMYHACHVSLSNFMRFFVFAKFSWDFCENFCANGNFRVWFSQKLKNTLIPHRLHYFLALDIT
jgi:hypothetical protein